MEDATVTPEKKLEGVELTAPDGAAGIDPDFAAAMGSEKTRLQFGDEYLLSEMEKLGYLREGGPIDASPAERAIFALTGVSADREELKGQLAAAEQAHDAEKAEWEAQRASLLDDTAKALKARDAAEAKLKKKGTVTTAETPAKPRKLGPIEPKSSPADAIAAAVEAGTPIEIAFSDGVREIGGIAPAKVTGEVWKDHARGQMLREPVTVTGPEAGGASVTIDGYALLIDGKQVAYCQRSEPVQVAPGQKVQLQDDIYF